ncbi:MAG: hypothetical protein ABIY55_22500 [Kofleriaceae bacterium]
MHGVKRVLGLAVVLVACGDDAGNAPSSVLVRTDPAGAQCAHGGSVISSGSDANHNAMLEDSEVQVRTPVCNPAPADPSGVVTRLAAEPSGAHCSDGGTAIETGVDGNGNGALDDGEVTHTDYICGEVLLTRLVPAETCAGGGVAIQLGRDRDHDGQLSDTEVEHTEVSCGDVLDANVVVSTAADLAALADIVLIHGDLELRDGGAMQLPKLQVVTGRLDVHGFAVGELVAPELTSVEGDLAVGGTLLATLSLPKLSRVGGNVLANANGVLTQLSLPALTSIGGDLTITSHSKLQTLDAPLDQIGGEVVVQSNSQLARLSFTLHTAPRSFHISNNGLTSFALNLFGAEQQPDVEVALNQQLTSIELWAAHFGRLSLSGDALASVAVHAPDVESLIVSGDALDRLTLSGAPGQPVQVRSLGLFGPVSTIDAGTTGVTVSSVCSLHGTKLADLRAFHGVNFLSADGNTALTEIKFVPLRSFAISNNPVLTSITSLDTSLHGLLQISNNPVLSEVSLHEVTELDGELDVTSNPQLTSLRAPALATVSNLLRISGNPLLAELDLSALLHIENRLDLFGTALTTLALPSLVNGGNFFIEGNGVLTQLVLPALRHVQILEISDNPHLPACAVEALFTGLTGSLSQERNDTTATCTP